MTRGDKSGNAEATDMVMNVKSDGMRMGVMRKGWRAVVAKGEQDGVEMQETVAEVDGGRV